MIIFNIACIVIALAAFLSSLLAGAVFGEHIAGPAFGFFAIVYSFVGYRYSWNPTLFWVIPLPAVAGYYYVMTLNQDFGTGGVVLGVFLAAIGVGLTYLPLILGEFSKPSTAAANAAPVTPVEIPQFYQRGDEQANAPVIREEGYVSPYDQPVPVTAYYEQQPQAPVYQQPMVAPVYAMVAAPQVVAPARQSRQSISMIR